ncbi:MAG: hypothetical protein JWM33_681 [Caulobacteraceae bacterium]|nr:hypothetical protein [Caulobacteraceae bacterium]
MISLKLTRRRLAVLPILAMAVGIAVLATSYRTSVRGSRFWIDHSHQVIQLTQTLFSQVQDAESAQRGFLLTHNEGYAEPYNGLRSRIDVTIDGLQRLVADNPSQARRVAAMGQTIQARMVVADQTMALGRAGEWDAAQAMVFGGKGAALMSQARGEVAEFTQAESAVLGQREGRARGQEELAFYIGLTIALIALGALAWSVFTLEASNTRLAGALEERDRAEKARQSAAALATALVDNLPDLLFVAEPGMEGDYELIDVNPALAAVAGAPRQALKGQRLSQMFPENGRAELIERARRVVSTGRVENRRDRVALFGGEVRSWEVLLASAPDGDGRRRLVGALRDVTDRERAEEQLLRAQRMDTIGQLTGGVAHDFNNLLQVIRANIEMAVAKVSDETVKRRLANALMGADRAGELTRRLLAFARRQPLEPKVINLARLVTDMTELLRRTLGERIEIETVVAGGLWNTLADPAQVENALLNLAINARDAMGGEGRLTIEVANAWLDRAYVERDPELTEGQYVLLAVSDTGSGMSPEVTARVFEPFFTTKADGKGTGLGLPMVYGFVKQSHGHIQIYSEVGSGTTLKIYLPRSKAVAEQAALQGLPEEMGTGETILVVEDEESVRVAACAMLQELGYRTIEAGDAAQALKLIEIGTPVDLMFTDVVMPGELKTRDMVARVQALRPGLPALYASGYTENAIVHHGRLDEGVSLLSKPYSRTELARKVAAALRSVRPRVLVVEDDPMVRQAAVETLGELGYEAVGAGDAEQALAALRDGGPFDILFADIGLPGLRGDALAASAVETWPAIKVVLASGYGEDAGEQAPAKAVRLAKPYDRASLKAALEGVQDPAKQA